MNGIQTFLKKSRISKILVSAIIPLVMLLSFLGSSRKVYAYDPVNVVAPPYAFVVPTYQDIHNGSYYTLRGTIGGVYTSYVWQFLDEDDQVWRDSSIHDLTFSRPYSETSIGEYRSHRLKVYYLDSDNQESYIYSNTVTIFLYTTPGNSQIISFEDFASTLLYRFLEWFNIFLAWMINNPIVFVFLALAIIISSIGTLRHVIGGSHEKKDFSY